MKDHSGCLLILRPLQLRQMPPGLKEKGIMSWVLNQKNRRTLLVTYHFLKSVTAPWPKHTLWKSNQIFRKVAQTHYTLLYLQTKRWLQTVSWKTSTRATKLLFKYQHWGNGSCWCPRTSKKLLSVSHWHHVSYKWEPWRICRLPSCHHSLSREAPSVSPTDPGDICLFHDSTILTSPGNTHWCKTSPQSESPESLVQAKSCYKTAPSWPQTCLKCWTWQVLDQGWHLTTQTQRLWEGSLSQWTCLL